MAQRRAMETAALLDQAQYLLANVLPAPPGLERRAARAYSSGGAASSRAVLGLGVPRHSHRG
eukprot:6365507-Prymnesium_polylepis.1